MTQRAIFRVWAPLEAAWLLMAVEGPFIAAVIARLSDPVLNLAGYGVAFPLAMLFESPIIMIMSASAALVAGQDSFLKLRRFTWGLNSLITLALVLFLLPPVFRWVTLALMGLPADVSRLAHGALTLLIPWPAAIGYRRFYQGILVRRGLTRRVAYGTALRLGSMSAAALMLASLTRWPGAWVGAAALSVGVVLEAAASRFWARDCVRSLMGSVDAEPEPLTYRSIAAFYVPLAMTSVLALGVNPMVSFFLGRAHRPLESLAVMPVVNSFVFIFNTAGLTFQEVVISLAREGEEPLRALRLFAIRLAAGASGLLLLVAFTPLSRLWFQDVAGLTPMLVAFAVLPVSILVVQPALTVLASFQRALLVTRRITRPITWATALEVLGIASVLLLLTRLGWVGATAAACALVAGRAASCAFLLPKMRGCCSSTPGTSPGG